MNCICARSSGAIASSRSKEAYGRHNDCTAGLIKNDVSLQGDDYVGYDCVSKVRGLGDLDAPVKKGRSVLAGSSLASARPLRESLSCQRTNEFSKAPPLL